MEFGILFIGICLLFGISFHAWPLVKKGLQNLKEGRFTLESFLGGSVIVAVAAGEATAALEILWIISGASLLQTWITERYRRVREARRIGSLLGKW